jgi:hypothetical protein
MRAVVIQNQVYIQSQVEIALPPLAYRLFGRRNLRRNLQAAHAFTGQLDNAYTHGKSLSRLGAAAPGE